MGIGTTVGGGVGGDVAAGSGVGVDVGLGVGTGVDVRVGVGAARWVGGGAAVGRDTGVSVGASGIIVASSVGAAVSVGKTVGSVLGIGVGVGEGVGAGVSVEGRVSVGSRRGVEFAANRWVGVGVLTSEELQAASKTNAAKSETAGIRQRRKSSRSLVIVVRYSDVAKRIGHTLPVPRLL